MKKEKPGKMKTMPKKPLVRIDVSWQTPKILILGGDSFLGKNFLQHLLGDQVEIWAVVSEKKDNHFKEEVKILSLAENWQTAVPKEINYLVDFLNFPETVNFAKKTKGRLLTVVDLEAEKEFSAEKKKSFDWRVVKTSFVYGPTDDLKKTTFLNKVLIQAVLNEKITIPFSGIGKIYPLYITDFCQFLEQALFSPAFVQKETVLAGEEVSWQKFLDYLEKEAQFTQGIRVEPDLSLPSINNQLLKKLSAEFDWQPQTDWQTGASKTLQFFFQKKEKGELIISEETQTEKPIAEEERGFLKTRILKSEAPLASEPSLSVIDRDFWGEPEVESKGVKPKRKKPIRKKRKKKKEKKKKPLDHKKQQPVVIEESWQKEKLSKKTKEKEKPEEKDKKEAKDKRIWPFLILGLLLLTGGYFWGGWLVSLVRIGLGGWHLRQSLAAVTAYRWEKAEEQAVKAEKEFGKGLNYLEWRPAQQLFCLSRLGKRGARVIIEGAKLADLGTELGRSIWDEAEKQTASFAQAGLQEKLLIRGESLQRELNLLEAELGGRMSFLPPSMRKKLSPLDQQINEAQLVLGKAISLLPQLDWWLGEDEPRRFLVLLQNNMELRPTGGFIGSLATLHFSGGKLINFDVQDVYSADGQLKGHVEPPLSMKEILGEKGWYLRDSNWSPDFPTNAQKAAWFYRKETGQEVDGVFAFNLEAAKKILTNIGEIYLADFGEKINADNLFAKAEFYSEANFFPGSQQKASFLTALGKQILASVQNMPAAISFPLTKSLWQSLEEKELLLWTTEEGINNVLMANNWDGRLKAVSMTQKGGLADYLFPVEANLGINKANYFLRRSLSLLVQINPQEKIDYLLQIHYENTSQTTEWPGGDYKNYLRLFLPLGSEINRVSVFDPLAGKEASQKFISRGEIKQTKEKDKMGAGFLVTVPINSRRTVEVSYSRPISLAQDQNGWKYLLYLQKQSGMGATPLTVLVSLPEGLVPLQVFPEATLTEQGLVFNKMFTSDIPIAIEFSRQE